MSPTPLRAVDSEESAGNALRAPPHNYDAERALLGAILMNNRSFERVSDFLLPDHFADQVNGRIYQACAKLIEQGRQANPVTLKTYLERDDSVIATGGMTYIAGLAAAAVTIINAGDYGKLIYDLALRRELIALGEDMVNDAFDAGPDETAMSQIEATEERLFTLTGGAGDGAMVDVEAAALGAIGQAEAAHKNGGKLVGLTTGLRDLDAKLGGLRDTDLLILAGRPSMGKTALATNIAVSAARYFQNPAKAEDRGKAVLFFSLEMSREQLATRILADITQLDSHAIRSGYLRDHEFERLVVGGQGLAGMPLKIDDTPSPTVAAIRSRGRRLARKGALGLIVIDYLQLVGSPGQQRAENRVQEISAITRGLKALAKDLRVPVLALSQLSRALEAREDKRPQLSDLRESGTIEQDADVVMFVFREQYYLERTEPAQRTDESSDRFHERYHKWEARVAEVQNTAEVIIGKQRHGPVGTVRCQFDAATTKFSDLESREPPPSRGVSRETHGGPPAGHPAAEQLPMEL